MFFSAKSGGFYSEAVHGARTLTIVDPNWVRSEVDGQPDADAVPPTLTITNPECAIPKDAVEITSERHRELLAGQAAGKCITADDSGAPVLTDPEPVPMPLIIEQAKARVRVARVAVFGTLAGIQSQALADGDTITAKAISSIQTELAAITSIDLSGCKNGDDVDLAFAKAWVTIAAGAPAKVAKAFNEVLS